MHVAHNDGSTRIDGGAGRVARDPGADVSIGCRRDHWTRDSWPGHFPVSLAVCGVCIVRMIRVGDTPTLIVPALSRGPQL